MNPIIITRIKLLFLFIISNIVLFVREGWYVSGGIALISLFLIFLLKHFQAFYTWIKGLTIIFIIILFIQTLSFDGLGYSPEGLLLGLYSITRIFALTSITFLFLHTTKLQHISQSFAFLPFHMGFVFTISMGMIYYLRKESTEIRIAQYARGYRMSWWNVIRTYMPVLLPVLARSMVRAERLAIAMQTRGWKIHQ